MTYSKALSSSDLLPHAYRGKPANVLVALALGEALGIAPTTALYGINVIQGKPTLSAETMRAIVLARGHRFDVVTFTEVEATVACARAERPGDVSTFSFTLEDAKRAGLVGGNYDKYPKAMLLARATSQACRAIFPDVLAGVSYTPDELDDVPQLAETTRPRAVERLSVADGHIVAGQPDAWQTPADEVIDVEVVEAAIDLVESETADDVNAKLDELEAAGIITIEPALTVPEPPAKLTGPAARSRAHSLAGPATAAQLGKLRALLREQKVTPAVLDAFAQEKLGFAVPLQLDELTRGQASALIDSLVGAR
jgi:hypothetical protein